MSAAGLLAVPTVFVVNRDGKLFIMAFSASRSNRGFREQLGAAQEQPEQCKIER